MNMMVRPTEVVRFNETDLDVYILGGLRWLRLAQICDSLQVVEKTAKRIFQQHKHEFAEDETGVSTSGNSWTGHAGAERRARARGGRGSLAAPFLSPPAAP